MPSASVFYRLGRDREKLRAEDQKGVTVAYGCRLLPMTCIARDVV
jgi:hypothetical protein